MFSVTRNYIHKCFCVHNFIIVILYNNRKHETLDVRLYKFYLHFFYIKNVHSCLIANNLLCWKLIFVNRSYLSFLIPLQMFMKNLRKRIDYTKCNYLQLQFGFKQFEWSEMENVWRKKWVTIVRLRNRHHNLPWVYYLETYRKEKCE